MSTGPRAEAAFIQESQSKVERGDAHSALFYLFQEVSKLASPTHDSFLDTNTPDKSPKETLLKAPFLLKEEEEDGQAFQVSLSSFQQSVSKLTQNKNVREESHDSTATTLDETAFECNSPWKVLSLINLHCEKLLHQRDHQELGSSSASTAFGRSLAALTPAAPGVTEGGARKDNVELTLRSSHLCGRREVAASTVSLEDLKGRCPGDGYELQCCVENAEGSCSSQPQTADETESVGVELEEEEASLDLQHGFKEEVGFSVGQLEQNCSSAENDTLDEALPENALDQTHVPKTCPHTQLTFSSNDKECRDLSNPALTLDHNANITFTTELWHDTQPPSPGAVLLSSRSAYLIFNTAEISDSLSTQEDKLSSPRPNRSPASVEEESPAAAQPKSSSCDASSASSGPELCAGKNEELGLPSAHQWRTKTPRKQPHPSRSADVQDPHFQGVTFRMDTELDDTREECRLLITSKYSKELCKSARKPRLRTRTSQKSIKASSSDDEGDLTNNVIKGKVCASCCTRKTPMWRDAEDGTPLCNACGIRYKKYRVRCVNCWHIPRKEGNSNSRCLKCGNFARLTSAQRKHTT